MDNSTGKKTHLTDSITLLSVSPMEEDHLSLQSIIWHSKWKLLKAGQLSAAADVLDEHNVSVVICELQFKSGTWIDLLRQIQKMPAPPSVILASRLADERLWAEALNLGAWDVLPKPFDRAEVLRSVKVAWEHWVHQVRISPQPAKVMKAAS